MAGIGIGNNSLSKSYWGTAEVSKIYLGNVELYSAGGGGNTFTLSVDADTSMEGNGDIDITYNEEYVYYFSEGEETTPVVSPITVVENATLNFSYWCRYGYCKIYQNGNLIHENTGGNVQTFSFTPQVGDAIYVDFYWED